MDVRQLVQQIEEAFPDNPPPPDYLAKEGLWFDEAGEPHAYVNEEALWFQKFFHGGPWHDFVGDPLIKWEAAAFSGLAFLNVRARIFYLPAYMLTAMFDIHGNPDMVEGLFNCLTHPNLVGLNEEERKQTLRWINSDDRLPGEMKERLRETFSRTWRWNPCQRDDVLNSIEQDYNDFIAAMTGPQKRAVRNFIAFMQNKYGVAVAYETERALSGYWGQVAAG